MQQLRRTCYPGILATCCLLLGLSFLIPVESREAGVAKNNILVIHAAHVFDGVSKTLKSAMTVVIADGRITDVLPGTRAIEGAETIELGDMTLLPGLIDCHQHLSPPETNMNPFAARLTVSPIEAAMGSAFSARKLLNEGFTTIRMVGIDNGIDLSLKRSIDRGWATGPRMMVALEPLGPTGGHSDPRNGVEPSWDNSTFHGSVIDNPAEAIKEVREHRRRGAELIKIMPSGGVLSIGDDPQAQLMSNDEIAAVVETAHALGLKVAAHAHGKAAIDNSIKLGVDSIEHGTYADADSYKLFIAKGVYLVPTLLVVEQASETARTHPERLNPSSADKLSLIAPLIKTMFAGAYRAGVKIAFGTDTSDGVNAHEFSLMTAGGMTPADALMTATYNAAHLLGISDTSGSIQPGRYADLIAVLGNPLSDISTMEHVQWVMKGGIVYKRDGIPLVTDGR